MDNNTEYLHRQLIKLGDMMGDGLHHEPDGAWISREYKQISKQLFPEMHKAKDAVRRENINSIVAKVVSEKKCECGGSFHQTRKGAMKVKCDSCNQRFVLKKRK